MNSVLQGLLILASYDDAFDMAAEHDQVWVYGKLDKLKPTDKVTLDILGWFWDENADGWTHFV